MLKQQDYNKSRLSFHCAGFYNDLEHPLIGANAFELEGDILMVKAGPFRIVPGQFDTPADSDFYGYAFYKASSIRKINGNYYFIYSSENANKLCYATSQSLLRGILLWRHHHFQQ